MTNSDGVQSGPLSWRDVYTLVENSQGLILGAVGEIKEDVTEIKRRVTSLERNDDRRDGAAEVRRSIGAVTKNSLTTIAAVAAVIIGLVNYFHAI